MAAAAMLTIFSCTEKENGDGTGTGNGSGNGNVPSGKENTPITLTADTVAPDMSQETQLSDVLTLSWNATTNMGTGARIEYTILIDEKGGSFESAYEVAAGANLSKTFTAGDLNKMLMDEFGYDADETVEVDVCVLATIKNDAVDDVISNVVSLTLTSFVGKTTELYLIGNATEAEWSLLLAIPMTPIAGVDGGFSWSGDLLAGEIKFLTTVEDWVPCYCDNDADGDGNGDGAGVLFYREKEWVDDIEDGEHTPDNKIRIATPGKYKITVNIEELTYSIERTGGAAYYSMYMTGSSVETPVEMYQMGYTFMKAVQLKAGDFYFSENAADNGGHFWAATAGQALTDGTVAADGGNKWTAKAGFYHVVLYIKEGKEKADIQAATPYETLYLIGSATSAGWTLPSTLAMTKKSDYVLEWEGPLNPGELKFTCDNQSDWMGAWYLASSVGKAPTGEAEPIFYLDKNNKQTAQMGLKEFDQKWNIKEGGTYKITLDQLAETVIIAKQ